MSSRTLSRKFWRFALPSMFAQLLNSLFIIVDGYFIGQNMGDTGLAAINIAWPMVAFMQAVSTCIGVGGAVRMAIDAGREDMDSAALECGHAIILLFAAAAALGLLMFISYPLLLPLLGANEELYPLTAEYIRTVSFCAACQVLCTGLLPLLRGEGRTMSAMALTVVGLLGNISLDWFFIQYIHWGIRGAALATAISQACCAVPCLLILLTNKKWPRPFGSFRLQLRRFGQIFRYGISSFGLSISTSILILLTNLRALRYGGTEGVAVYAVLSYILGSVIPLISGVGDGIQPLLSNSFGAGNWDEVNTLRRKGMALAVSAALVCSAFCWGFREELPVLFGAGPSAAAKCASAAWTLCLAFPFTAAVRFSCSYFCALGIPSAGSILAYGEPLGAQPLFLFLLPLVWGLQGVWISYPVAMIIMTLVSLILLSGHFRRQREWRSREEA